MTQVTRTSYTASQILMEINSGLNYKEWVDIYKRIVSWELKIDESNSTAMGDILSMQKNEANNAFSKFIVKNYLGWLKNGDGPIMSDRLLREKVLPQLEEGTPTVMLLLDNLRAHRPGL